MNTDAARHTAPETAPETAATGTRGRVPGELSEHDEAVIVAAIAAGPPLTDEQVKALGAVIAAARERERREAHRSTPPDDRPGQSPG